MSDPTYVDAIDAITKVSENDVEGAHRPGRHDEAGVQ